MLLHSFVIPSILVAVFLVTGSQVATGQCNNTANLNSTQHVQTFYSPGYPANYSSNKRCSWLITAPSNQRVLLYFASFQLEDHVFCNYDNVAIYDAKRANYYRRLTKRCGSTIPLPVYSSGRYLYVTFRSDQLLSFQGFAAKFSSLTNSSDCPRTVSGDSTGVIYSPGFPWSYPNNKQCYWYIRVPYGRVKLTFTTFKLDPYTCSDYVRVTDSDGTLIATKCRRYFYSFTIASTGNTLRVRFSSNPSGSYQGFMAFYQTEVSPTTLRPPTGWWTTWTTRPYTGWFTRRRTRPYTGWFTRRTTRPYYWWTSTPTGSPAASYACEAYSKKVLMVDSASSIASPNYPGSLTTFASYKPTCSWKVVTKDKDYLELTFDDMSISRCGSTCLCGKITVREDYQYGRDLGTFCQGKALKVSSKRSAMFVEYYPSDRFDKFKATIRAKNIGPSAAEVAVPLVVGLVLFGIIFAVIKCTKIIPSTGQPGTSNACEVPMQSFPPGETFAPQPNFPQPPQGEINEGVCN